jgi:hypothetical protein
MPLQIRRGTDAERQSMTVPLAPGEMLYTTDTQKIYVGNGTTLGGILTSGFNDDDAKDAAAGMITTASHSGISFSYDVVNKTLSATTDLDSGSVKDAAAEMITTASHSGISFSYDSLNKTLSASIDSLNATGPITADAFVGSVFADNSTLLVDGINGRIVGPVFSNVTGSVFADDSDILVDSTNKVLRGTHIGDSISESIETNFFKISLDQVDRPTIVFERSLGSTESPTALTLFDRVGEISFRGFDGNNYITGSGITSLVGSTVSPGVLPSSLIFSVTENSGDTNLALTIGSDGITRLRQSLSITQETYSFSSAQVLIQQFHNNPDSNKFNFFRARGSASLPAAIQDGDDIQDIGLAGYDGSAYSIGSSMSWIVDGNVSSGIVPTKFVFRTHNGINSAVRLTIEKTGDVLLTGSLLTSSDGGIGYTTGAGGTATQLTDKTTSVTLNKITGQITTVDTELGAGDIVSFILNNSTISDTDHVIVSHVSGGSLAAYTVTASATNGSAIIYIRNNTPGPLSESIVLKFTVIKSVLT